VAICLLTAAATSHATLIVDTTPSQNGTLWPFGEPSLATYGQTFTVVASHPVLTGFTFFLDDQLDTDVVDFAAYVMAWDGSKATGPILFQSGALATTNNGGVGGDEAFPIDTGRLTLVPGQQYVAFFSASNYFNSITGTASVALVGLVDAYPGGTRVFTNNGTNFAALTTTTWLDPGTVTDDASFVMTFEVVPEPASMSLLSLGALALLRRRRTS
jgi:hypothetical protein